MVRLQFPLYNVQEMAHPRSRTGDCRACRPNNPCSTAPPGRLARPTPGSCAGPPGHNSSGTPGRRFFIEYLKAISGTRATPDDLAGDDCRRLGCQCNRSRPTRTGGSCWAIRIRGDPIRGFSPAPRPSTPRVLTDRTRPSDLGETAVDLAVRIARTEIIAHPSSPFAYRGSCG